MKPILEKCIVELKADAPRIDYVLGMLETLVGMDAPTISMTPVMMPPKPLETITIPAQTDEAAILDAQARAAIAAVQDIAKASGE